MARFVIETTQEEQEAVLKVLKEVEGKTMSVGKLAEMADMPQSRVRYAILDLLDKNKIAKIATKAINKYYVRYTYKIL